VNLGTTRSNECVGTQQIPSHHHISHTYSSEGFNTPLRDHLNAIV
jgi:hypothetical protein